MFARGLSPRRAEVAFDVPGLRGGAPEKALRGHHDAEIHKWVPLIKAANIKVERAGGTG